MSAKHTPGEWGIVEKKYEHVVSSWFIKIGEVELGFFPYKRIYSEDKTQSGLVSDEEQHANARLIVAAPDFFDGAQDFVAYEDAMEAGDDVRAMALYDSASKNLRAAIAKATGESK